MRKLIIEPNKITPEIAYVLGRFEGFDSFYSTAIWRVNKDTFNLYEYFNWTFDYNSVTTDPLKNKINWDEMSLWGTLKTELINTDELKIAYICGSLDSYLVQFTETLITKHYANSYDLRDFMYQCLNDVLRHKYKFDARYGVYKSEIPNTIPGSPYIQLEGEPKVIEFFKNERDKWINKI